VREAASVCTVEIELFRELPGGAAAPESKSLSLSLSLSFSL